MFKFILLVLIFMLIYSIISSLFKAVSKGKTPKNSDNETTIIRNEPEHEKIFKKNEGEYVDFEEIKDADKQENN